MPNLAPGLSNETKTTVTEAMSADHMGSGSVRVLATPMMIALMEYASHGAVAAYLEPGQTTVGVLVNVRHLAATPIGMVVRITSELVAVEGRKLTFKVEAFDAADKIGEGFHERMIIDQARFEARVTKKQHDATLTAS